MFYWNKGHHFRVLILLCQGEGDIERTVIGKVRTNTAESENLCMRGDSKRGCVLWKTGREIPSASGAKPHGGSFLERPTNLSEGNVGMNAFGKSDDFVVLSTRNYASARAMCGRAGLFPSCYQSDEVNRTGERTRFRNAKLRAAWTMIADYMVKCKHSCTI